jgi:hypothetical protein
MLNTRKRSLSSTLLLCTAALASLALGVPKGAPEQTVPDCDPEMMSCGDDVEMLSEALGLHAEEVPTDKKDDLLPAAQKIDPPTMDPGVIDPGTRLDPSVSEEPGTFEPITPVGPPPVLIDKNRTRIITRPGESNWTWRVAGRLRDQLCYRVGSCVTSSFSVQAMSFTAARQLSNVDVVIVLNPPTNAEANAAALHGSDPALVQLDADRKGVSPDGYILRRIEPIAPGKPLVLAVVAGAGDHALGSAARDALPLRGSYYAVPRFMDLVADLRDYGPVVRLGPANVSTNPPVYVRMFTGGARAGSPVEVRALDVRTSPFVTSVDMTGMNISGDARAVNDYWLAHTSGALRMQGEAPRHAITPRFYEPGTGGGNAYAQNPEFLASFPLKADGKRLVPGNANATGWNPCLSTSAARAAAKYAIKKYFDPVLSPASAAHEYIPYSPHESAPCPVDAGYPASTAYAPPYFQGLKAAEFTQAGLEYWKFIREMAVWMKGNPSTAEKKILAYAYDWTDVNWLNAQRTAAGVLPPITNFYLIGDALPDNVVVITNYHVYEWAEAPGAIEAALHDQWLSADAQVPLVRHYGNHEWTYGANYAVPSLFHFSMQEWLQILQQEAQASIGADGKPAFRPGFAHLEVYPNYSIDGPRIVALDKLMWDPNTDLWQLYKTYSSDMYGPAASGHMFEYFMSAEKLWSAMIGSGVRKDCSVSGVSQSPTTCRLLFAANAEVWELLHGMHDSLELAHAAVAQDFADGTVRTMRMQRLEAVSVGFEIAYKLFELRSCAVVGTTTLSPQNEARRNGAVAWFERNVLAGRPSDTATRTELIAADATMQSTEEQGHLGAWRKLLIPNYDPEFATDAQHDAKKTLFISIADALLVQGVQSPDGVGCQIIGPH